MSHVSRYAVTSAIFLITGSLLLLSALVCVCLESYREAAGSGILGLIFYRISTTFARFDIALSGRQKA